MFAKLFTLWCVCGLAVAAPGIYDGLGLASAYAAPAYAAPAYAAPVIHAAPAYAAPVIRAAEPVVQVAYDPAVSPVLANPNYSFAYGVADPTTGDQKDQTETLQNGVVHGAYSLVEPDGNLRRVTYTADDVNGFNAVVERTGGGHGVAAPIAKIVAPAPVAVAAPIARYTLPAVAHPWG